MFKKLILFLFAVMSFSYVDANEANLHKAKLLFTSYFEEFKTLEAKFVQHIFDENNIFSESMEGSFYVERPNKFRWHYMKPYEQIFVADGLNFYSYDVDLEQIIIKPQEQIYDQSQVILFLNDNRLLEYYKIEKASLEQDIYKDPQTSNDLYLFGELLTELADIFARYRFQHYTTVERILGFKPGTGGSAGVNWLKTMAAHRFFPELWSMRTDL